MFSTLRLRRLPTSSSTLSRRYASTTLERPPVGRARKYGRRAGYVALGVGAALGADQAFNEHAVTRNLRTLWTCAVIALDYKLNFTPDTSDAIPALHERVADRIYYLLTTNGGLYIKIGQAIGANAALLPRAFQSRFAKLFDDAPQVPYETVLKVFKQEFNRPPDGPNGVFAIFEHEAAASASVAQVHRAKTHDGEWVAVKIQKPAVGKQVSWDLASFKMVMWMYEHWVFNLPVYFVADFITSHLRRELDFVLEAKNAQETMAYISREPRLRDRVYVPKVYSEYSTTRVMTAEWIDGVRLSDKAGVRRLMGEDGKLKTELKTPEGLKDVGPLKGGLKVVGQTMVDLFCAQIFDWGWVHCDPHPGNVIMRPNPNRPSTPQLVLLDHGLYVRLSDEFRIQYSMLWKALLSVDQPTITSITSAWGFGAPDLFASATLLRPVQFGQKKAPPKRDHDAGEPEKPLTNYEIGVRMKEKLRSFLTDTDKMPKEIVFIGRNMRIVQGNNQALGSPVNRVKVMGTWASGALVTAPGLSAQERIREYFSYFRFRTALFALDAVFWGSRLRGWVRERLGLEREGFEDELERKMRGIAKSNFGMDIGPNAFQG